jgi:hypothetical protein
MSWDRERRGCEPRRGGSTPPESRRRIETWRRAGCIPVPRPAALCTRESVTIRHSSGSWPSSKQRVGGSIPSRGASVSAGSAQTASSPHLTRGRIGPSGNVEIRQGEARLLRGQRVGVDADRRRGICVPELLGNPADALARGERPGRPTVARTMELEFANPLCLGSALQASPDLTQVAPVRRGARRGAG